MVKLVEINMDHDANITLYDEGDKGLLLIVGSRGNDTGEEMITDKAHAFELGTALLRWALIP